MAGDVRQGRRGNVMVIGLAFSVLLGFSAVAVDVGMIRLADTQLQASLDAAAFSGANEFDGTTTGVAKAITRTKTVADLNRVLDTNLNLPTSAITTGYHNKSDGTFSPYPGVDVKFVNSVRVSYSPPPVSSILGQVAFGTAGYTISARSQAVRPRGTAKSSNCFLPFAVPKCLVEQSLLAGANPKPLWFYVSSDNSDSVAYANFVANPSNQDVMSMIQGQCDSSAGTLEIGDPLYVNNGALNNVFTYIETSLNNLNSHPVQQWDTGMYGILPLRLGRTLAEASPIGGANAHPTLMPAGSGRSSVTVPNWGTTMQGPIAVVNGGTSDTGLCEDIKFVDGGNDPAFFVDSIAWGIIFDIRAQNTGPNPRNIVVQLDIMNQHETEGEVDEGNMNGPVLAFGETYSVNW